MTWQETQKASKKIERRCLLSRTGERICETWTRVTYQVIRKIVNVFSYGEMIQGLVKGKRLEDAVEFCVEMLEAGHSPKGPYSPMFWEAIYGKKKKKSQRPF
ncbi:uncharacterized protein A4U43_C03F15970 [Asparagus officinalis]|uniref:Pentatricopeptide repeat-containing protein n=1 Tax=Asparagus officinalis TaxID=4686 RepID=A0A5P1FAG2_ASPOF|nr:uncharacterized protein A4U43_C03F15970 [Asparagus officinalis]